MVTTEKRTPDHAGRVISGLADADDRRTRRAARSIEAGIVETGDDMRVGAGALGLRNPRQHSRHGKRAVVISLDRGRTEFRLARHNLDARRRGGFRRRGDALRHGCGRVRVYNMKTQRQPPAISSSMKDQISPKHNLAINPERLWDEIMETAKIGETAKGGICRLTLTDLDRQVRDWFKARATAFGCTVTVDDMGVMFARRPGQRDDLPPIAMGSHLDTQPTGGKFDGVLGVLSALEALRTMHEAGYETFAPIEVVNFTNEEGSRFAPAMIASGVFAKVFERDWAAAQKDRGGVTFGDALETIGYRGGERCGAHPLSAFFELHIEQGPILEEEDKEIGIVTDVQGMRWYECTLIGQEAHTGATPMRMRKNALVGAARMIEAIEAIAHRHAPLAVGAVGLARSEAEFAQCRSGRSVLHRGFPASRERRARCDGKGDACGIRRHAVQASDHGRDDAHLGSAAGGVRQRLREFGPPGGRAVRFIGARDRLRRRTRCGLCVARCAGGDDFHPVQGRHQPQRGGIFLEGTMCEGRAGPAASSPRL